jgi:hypothetical protein
VDRIIRKRFRSIRFSDEEIARLNKLGVTATELRSVILHYMARLQTPYLKVNLDLAASTGQPGGSEAPGSLQSAGIPEESIKVA